MHKFMDLNPDAQADAEFAGMQVGMKWSREIPKNSLKIKIVTFTRKFANEYKCVQMHVLFFIPTITVWITSRRVMLLLEDKRKFVTLSNDAGPTCKIDRAFVGAI